jgi:hypothetical protein
LSQKIFSPKLASIDFVNSMHAAKKSYLSTTKYIYISSPPQKNYLILPQNTGRIRTSQEEGRAVDVEAFTDTI